MLQMLHFHVRIYKKKYEKYVLINILCLQIHHWNTKI